jgi:hypothetical protein
MLTPGMRSVTSKPSWARMPSSSMARTLWLSAPGRALGPSTRSHTVVVPFFIIFMAA